MYWKLRDFPSLYIGAGNLRLKAHWRYLAKAAIFNCGHWLFHQFCLPWKSPGELMLRKWDIDLAEKLHVARYVADLVKISDRAKDLSDRLALIVAEQAY